MADPFVAEVRIWACNFAPRQWAFCGGQILPIQQYTALFALIGTYYGGNGTTTFALPNFQGRVAVDAGTGPGLSTYVVGEMTGTPTTALLISEIPSHSHTMNGALPGSGGGADERSNVGSPQAWLGPSAGGGNAYSDQPPSANLAIQMISVTGGSLPHNNMQPYLTLNFCIALQGIFPARN
jgi:microcystin-dependent protein